MKLKIFFLLLTVSLTVCCQKNDDTDLLTVNHLSSSLKEISGIAISTSDKNLYAINDSGNSNTLFRLDLKGNILEELKVPNSENNDWEDLAYDKKGTIYIGDFGNNYNDRKNLAIYEVTGIGSDSLKTSKTEFTLEDQKKFPPGKKNRNFDIEAFIYKNGSFYLFSKNRSSKFDGKTKLYKVKKQSGKQNAILVSSYKTCDDPNDCFISGAAISNKGDKIALLTYNKIFVLSDFKNDNLFNSTIKKIKLNHYSQKEGICFKNDSTLLIVDEKRKSTNGKLYQFILPK
ncbi:SdiA-regulated domain-containing protein [Aquimarina sp. 2201CG14-23]|uniref:SdiA-regulated domain-containing protein n=1 Tax=Aquimarina mycalae TaxID=3040073 RepID=UPI002477E723|nr:SdiA-regulated domain-containing protein [Aquimarina sp. 2201CG14-23]MDH7443992.1 SdiA-regulated domain-containing protein [Aquimarina sp. 2201CG14-23]